jgi:pimeloyl-ACP methyl ester carboxylesterase
MPLADLGDFELYYKAHGEGDPVLGIMGFASDHRLWAAQIPAVTQTHRFIVFDNRGIGKSTGQAVATIDEMADDAVRLMDKLGIERSVVFGVSMGGAIAQRVVLDHPDRVSALMLGITFARPMEFMRRQHEFTRTILRAAGADALVHGALLRMFTPKFFEIGRDFIDKMVEVSLGGDAPPASVEAALAQLDALDKHDVLADLPRVSVPTIVLGARNDQMVPGFGSEEIAAAIPGAELHMFETGHGCMIEEMEPFNAAVSAFLARL